jgi:hypothetical protein
MPTVTSSRLLRGVALASLFVLACIVLLRLAGCALALLIAGSKTPKFILEELAIYVAAGIAIAGFHFWKFGVVVVGLIDMSLILTHHFPWGGVGFSGFFSQFTTDLILLIAAIVAAVSYKRRDTELGVSHD